MNSFVNKLFTRKSFEAEFILVANVDGLKEKNIYMPEGVRSVVRLLLSFFFFIPTGKIIEADS